MTKPDYSPDPPPVKGPNESADDFIVRINEYNTRQFERIRDWWPGDWADRVDELEDRNAQITCTVPIVDYSYISITGETEVVVDPALLLFRNGFSQLSETDYDGWDAGRNFSAATLVSDIVNDGKGTMVAVSSSDLESSTDALTWSAVTSPGMKAGQALSGLVYSNDEWVCIGQAPGSSAGIRVASSTDLSSWTQEYETTLAPSARAVAHCCDTDGNGNICVASYDGTTSKILYSTDNGSSWQLATTTLSTSSNHRLQRVFYKNGAWWALGYTTSVWRSTDMDNWTLVLQTGANTRFASSIEFGNGLYVVGQGGAAPYNYFTSPSGDFASWTDRGALISAGPQSIYYDATLDWAWVSGTAFKESSTGTSWTDNAGSYSALAGITRIERTP